MAASDYQVVIVGGRPAGSSLALRLGRAGVRVLILEKARLEKQPPVSLPFLLNSAMQLVDELDIPESDYCGDAPRLRRFYLHFRDYFRTQLSVSEVARRDYVYVVDRVRFDGCLWRKLATFPSVDKVEQAKVQDLLRDDHGQVCGVSYRDAQGQTQQVRAPWVVGADGRFSLVARKAGATVIESHPSLSTSTLFAYFAGVRPYEPRDGEPHAVQIYTSCDGYSAIAMPTSGGRVGVVYQGRSDRFAPGTCSIDDYYRQGLVSMPPLWARMADATRVSPIYGMKRIANLYRQAGGPGWLLVGDAYHQKDFIDAQGIYDALLESKLLAACLLDWHAGKLAPEELVHRYQAEAYAATRPMFGATLDRLRREIYSSPPPWVAKTLLRTLLTSPDYMARFAQLLSRKVDPARWAPAPFVLGSMLKNLPRVLFGNADG